MCFYFQIHNLLADQNSIISTLQLHNRNQDLFLINYFWIHSTKKLNNFCRREHNNQIHYKGKRRIVRPLIRAQERLQGRKGGFVGAGSGGTLTSSNPTSPEPQPHTPVHHVPAASTTATTTSPGRLSVVSTEKDCLTGRLPD